MKTRLHLKALVLTLGLSCLPAVQAGVPVVEATNIIYTPLEYMEIAEQTVNTIQQIENQIMMYMNQIKQIEQAAQNLKGSLDFKDIQSISDLQYRIGRLKNAYRSQIEAYNNWAKATNAYTNYTCDWVNLYLNCTEELEKRAKEVEEANNNRKKELTQLYEDFTEQAEKDGAKVKKAAEDIFKKHDEKKTGTNQILLNHSAFVSQAFEELIKNQSYANQVLTHINSTTTEMFELEKQREKAKEILKKLRQQPPKFKVHKTDDKN